MTDSFVYIVTHGCYSDYTIYAVFSTEELAKAFVNRIKEESDGAASDYAIEKWFLDARRERQLGVFVCYITIDGDVYEEDYWSFMTPESQEPCIWRIPKNHPEYDPESPTKLRGFGTSAEHARRSAEQFRREYLDLGGEQWSPESTGWITRSMFLASKGVRS